MMCTSIRGVYSLLQRPSDTALQLSAPGAPACAAAARPGSPPGGSRGAGAPSGSPPRDAWWAAGFSVQKELKGNFFVYVDIFCYVHLHLLPHGLNALRF